MRTLVAVGLAALAAGAAEQFHVSPAGRDAWSGRLAAPKADLSDGPFATLGRARDAVRELKAKGLAAPVEVLLASGVYRLTEPVRFTPEDSGTAACPITYRAAAGAVPVLSGGVPVTGWQQRPDGLWEGDLPAAREADFEPRLLRVGNPWATRARHPNADPANPYTGGWAIAEYGGEPWERGVFNVGVANVHNVGDTLTWRVRAPAAGTYRVWLRYGHNMAHYETPEMGGKFTLQAGAGEPVPLLNLPDTGSWSSFRWSPVCDLELTAGEQLLTWANRAGGGINMDAFALCDDAAWDPAQAIGTPTWWGAVEIRPPAAGKSLLIVQTEACETANGPEIKVPKPTPPGTTRHLRYRAGDLPAWGDVSGAEVHVFIAWGWVNAIVPLAAMDPETRRLVFAGDGASQDVRPGNRYFVENQRAALDAPGEWFCDRATGKVLYIPDQPGFPDLPVVAARLEQVLILEGDPAAGRFVEYLRFEGLQITDTTYTLTQDYYSPANAAVVFSGARHCTLRGSTFSWIGGYGLKLTNRSEQCEFSRNHVHHAGQGGVLMQGGTAEQPHHCAVLGNVLEHLGLIYKHVAGVYLIHGSDHRIAHNRISDVPRYAISMKSQGEDRLSHRNIVEFNDIRRCNLETNDTGAIETLGYEHRDSGNLIRYNRILDSVGLATDVEGRILTPHFTWGVYLDDYSSGTTITGNIIARTVNGGVCVHGGQNNVIQNNILIEGHDHQVRLQPRDDFMKGNRFRNNIVVYSRPEAALIFSWNDRRDLFSEWDANVYWLRGGDLNTVAGRVTPLGSYAEWRAAGFDATSVVADPLFVDAAADDYRLQPGSPALPLGFVPIPVAKIGPDGLDPAE